MHRHGHLVNCEIDYVDEFELVRALIYGLIRSAIANVSGTKKVITNANQSFCHGSIFVLQFAFKTENPAWCHLSRSHHTGHASDGGGTVELRAFEIPNKCKQTNKSYNSVQTWTGAL